MPHGLDMRSGSYAFWIASCERRFVSTHSPKVSRPFACTFLVIAATNQEKICTATMQRTALVPYTFKDGLTVPAGFSVNFTALQHSLDEDIHGPNAAVFEPKRWVNRRQGFDTSKYQFASTSDDWLNWGGGPHACPGRFLADIAIKLTLVYLLTNYEIKYPEGRSERPADGKRNLIITPDMTLPIMFKQVSKWREWGVEEELVYPNTMHLID